MYLQLYMTVGFSFVHDNDSKLLKLLEVNHTVFVHWAVTFIVIRPGMISLELHRTITTIQNISNERLYANNLFMYLDRLFFIYEIY